MTFEEIGKVGEGEDNKGLEAWQKMIQQHKPKTSFDDTNPLAAAQGQSNQQVDPGQALMSNIEKSAPSLEEGTVV